MQQQHWIERHIRGELARKGFNPKKTGTGQKAYLWIPCPFHQESAASFEIRLDGKWCRCFGCGWKGDWDRMAHELGLAALFTDDSLAKHEYEIADTLRYLKDKLKQDAELHIVSLPPGVEPWRSKSYRGISLKTLKTVPTYLWYDDKFQTERILWPVFVLRKLMGWVSRRLDTVDVARYFNMPDTANEEWVAASLFMIDHVPGDVAVVVEGPVDALFLQEHGIPAVAFLGGGWSQQKTYLLAAKGVKRVFIIPDNDPEDEDGNKAGDGKAIKVYEALRSMFDTKILRLPKKFGDAAELDLPTIEKIKRVVLRVR